MKQTIKIISVVSLLFCSLAVSGQQQRLYDFKSISSPRIHITKSFEKNFVMVSAAPNPVTKTNWNGRFTAPVSPDHYTRNFGFFCKEELQLQKRTGVNFSLRLGTLDYCNFLEGKSKAVNTSF